MIQLRTFDEITMKLGISLQFSSQSVPTNKKNFNKRMNGNKQFH